MEMTDLNKELLEQYLLAGSETVSINQLRVLASHFCDKIRLRVAENPRTPSTVLGVLANDSNHDIRVAVAGNPACHESVLRELVGDNDIVVRHGIAQNISTPKRFLEILAEDENGWVRGEAIKTLEILGHRSFDEVGRRRGQSRKSRNRIRRFNQRKDKKQAAS
jgi:hypothetical protein